MKTLTLKEMQELLPDYVFGKLENSSKEVFEQNLPAYPEIQKEARDAKAVFAKFASTDIDAAFRSHTRNLSIKVNSRLERKNRKHRSGGIMKYAIPVACVIALATFMFNKHNNTQVQQVQRENSVATVKTIPSPSNVSIPAEEHTNSTELKNSNPLPRISKSVKPNSGKTNLSVSLPTDELLYCTAPALWFDYGHQPENEHQSSTIVTEMLNEDLAELKAEDAIVTDIFCYNITYNTLEEIDNSEFETIIKEMTYESK